MDDAITEPQIFAQLAAALAPDGQPLSAEAITTARERLSLVRTQAEGMVDAAGLVLERVDAFDAELERREMVLA